MQIRLHNRYQIIDDRSLLIEECFQIVVNHILVDSS